jgi:uncharacterized 2Fe-2S/4Fe-4S cluster protein (DUF4445 family)
MEKCLGHINLSPSTKVLFEPIGKKIDASANETILEIATRAGVGIRSECGGAQTCGKCRIIVKNGRGLTSLTDKERQILSQENISEGQRLACAVRLVGDLDRLTITLPPGSLVRERKFMEEGIEGKVKLDPAFRKFVITVSKPAISDRRSDEVRLLDSLDEKYGLRRLSVDYSVLKDLPNNLYPPDALTAVVWNDSELISLEKGDTSSIQYALAIDVGTSRITCSLVDTSTGRRLARRSIENPQITYGEDVMTRVSFSQMSNENRVHLQQIVVEGINQLIEILCTESNISPTGIYEAVVVGNTVMHHMFLGIETKYLAMFPFEPVTKASIHVKSEELGLKMNHAGIVTLLPIIDVFVGSDAVGDILSTRLHRSRTPNLLLDIGTNTEVMLSHNGIVSACSCASGPAFEGVHIEHGMKAVTGAIESLRIGRDGLDLSYDVIGGSKPIGLCGSGIVDAIAQLLSRGIIDRVGRFNTSSETPRLKKQGGVTRFVVAWSEESGTGSEITVSQKDITEVILAKAAIYSACASLMVIKKLEIKDLYKIMVAGAFGSHLDKNNAKAIGLLPAVDNNRIHFVGNSALAGAEMALKSRRNRLLSDRISKSTTYVELATSNDFDREFTGALWLPHRDPSRFQGGA